MQPRVSHTNLTPMAVEARAYQLEAVDESLAGSMMLVLPTAAGKTAVSWMVIADKLLEGNGWILMLAPTVALVNQHLKGMISILNEGFNPISITGQNPANKRSAMWASSRVIIDRKMREEVPKQAIERKAPSRFIGQSSNNSPSPFGAVSITHNRHLIPNQIPFRLIRLF